MELCLYIHLFNLTSTFNNWFRHMYMSTIHHMKLYLRLVNHPKKVFQLSWRFEVFYSPHLIFIVIIKFFLH